MYIVGNHQHNQPIEHFYPPVPFCPLAANPLPLPLPGHHWSATSPCSSPFPERLLGGMVRYVRSLLRVWLLSLNTMLWTALWVVFYTSLQILVVFSHYWVVFYCLDVAHFVLPFTSRKRLGCFQNACFVYNRFKLCKVGI